MQINFTPFPNLPADIPFTPFAHRPTFIDLSGRRFGRWTVIKETPNPKPGQQTRWHCRCDCGKEKLRVMYGSLIRGKSQSCGCLRMEGLVKPDATVHSQRNPAYRVWQSMKTRCFNVRHPSYHHYGERGITMCPEWAEDFDQFLKDMGSRPKGLSIERINNSGNYEPGNCQWGTAMEQAGNTRRNIVVQWKGMRCNLIDVARVEQVGYQSLSYRYQNKGMTIEDSVADLQARGITYHERAAEAGSTRKNKTDRTRRSPGKKADRDLTDRTFGRWTVISCAYQYRWNCRCTCGKEQAVLHWDLMSGDSQSCGCLKRDLRRKPLHAKRGHVNPTYRAWHAMKSRQDVWFIWRTKFEAFLKDMGPRPAGSTLIQVDPREGWTPENCRWSEPVVPLQDFWG